MQTTEISTNTDHHKTFPTESATGNIYETGEYDSKEALRSGSGAETALERGVAYCANHHPHLQDVLADRYDAILPGFSESLIEWAYGRHYSRGGVDARTRQLATIGALTVLGGQTGPQLKINIEHSLAVGASRQEILEIIWQMAVYGGLPAAINGLNAAMEVFANLDEKQEKNTP